MNTDQRPVPLDDNGWTYAIATPDATLGGALPALFAVLDRHGLKPTACRLIQLDVGRMKRFYRTTKFLILNPGESDYEFAWDMHGRLYGLAPACLIMLSDTTGADACQKLMECKGETRPEIARPHSVRSLGENVIFNLIHSPDDAASARAELPILLDDQGHWMLTLARDWHSRPPELTALVGRDALLDALPVFAGPEAISFPFIANRVWQRVVTWLALALRDNPAAVAALAEAKRNLNAERDLLRKCHSTVERLRVALSAGPQAHHLALNAAQRLEKPTFSDSLNALANLYDLRGARDHDNILALADHGVYLAPLEQVMIESHSHAFRPNSEIDGIYSPSFTNH